MRLKGPRPPALPAPHHPQSPLLPPGQGTASPAPRQSHPLASWEGMRGPPPGRTQPLSALCPWAAARSGHDRRGNGGLGHWWPWHCPRDPRSRDEALRGGRPGLGWLVADVSPDRKAAVLRSVAGSLRRLGPCVCKMGLQSRTPRPPGGAEQEQQPGRWGASVL